MTGRFQMSVLTAVTLISAVAGSRVTLGATNADRWLTYNNGYDGDRFSSAAQITPANVATLKRVCELSLGDAGAFHAGPLLVDGTFYINTTHTTVALDPRNCQIRWRYVYHPVEKEVYQVNRGLAYLDGRLFRGTGDGRVLALDAKSGRELWVKKAGDPTHGEFFSSAPIAWHGLVFIGAAGSDWAIRGFMLALDAETGHEKWRFYTIPMGDETGAETWKNPKTAEHGGGGLWTTYTLDPERRELFVPVANPAPDYAPDWRPGSNLFTDSLVVLDAETGRLKWYHQFQSNDGLDYDFGAAPALYRSANGAERLVAGSKDGHVYGLDRTTHKVLWKTPVTTIENRGNRALAGGRACPGSLGGVEWNGPAVDPSSRRVYVGAVDWCFTFIAGEPKYVPGQFYFGTNATPIASEGGGRGWVYSLDGDSGKPLWKYHADAPVVAGVTPTAGGVVFTGDLAGNLLALNADSGELLYKYNTGGAIAGGVITYELDGRQYLATTSGNISRMFSASTGSPKIVILTTGLDKDEPTLVSVPDEQGASGRTPVEHGASLFAQYCSSCHGASGEGSVGPALKGESARKSTEQAIAFIKEPKAPMPKLYPAPLSEGDVADVAAFVESLH